MHCVALKDKTQKSQGTHLQLGSLRFLLCLVHIETSAIFHLQLKFAYPGVNRQANIYLWGSATETCDSLYLPSYLSVFKTLVLFVTLLA